MTVIDKFKGDIEQFPYQIGKKVINMKYSEMITTDDSPKKKYDRNSWLDLEWHN